MRVNRALNLVVPVQRDDVTIYFHSTPISRAVYEGNFRLIAAAHAEIFGSGGAYAMNGARIAALTLKDVGAARATESGREGDGGAAALLGEIRRLTVAIAPNGVAWDTIPVDAAIAKGLIDQDEWSEVENAIVFFTLIWWMTPVMNREATCQRIIGMLGLSITPLSPTEQIDSLRTSIIAENTVKAESSVPS